MKVIIAGSRSWDNYKRLKEELDAFPHPITEVVSGKCPTGADIMGELWAQEKGIPVKAFPADWSAHGKTAGPIRNRQMAKYADALVLFWNGTSKGSANMLQEAIREALRITEVKPTCVTYHGLIK